LETLIHGSVEYGPSWQFMFYKSYFHDWYLELRKQIDEGLKDGQSSRKQEQQENT
jgi:hypothetical protein